MRAGLEGVAGRVRPTGRQLDAPGLGHAEVNLPTKFEVPILNRYRDIKGDAKCRKWGGLVHKRLKIGPEFLLTITILFCTSPLHTLYAALT